MNNILNKLDYTKYQTTKPTNQVTALSLSYDIIKTHGGVLKVETMVGEARQDDSVGRGTLFVILITEL